MFIVEEDLSISATRGDIVFFTVSAMDDGYPHKFMPGDIVRMAIYGKKNAESVAMQKDFAVTEVTERVMISLDEQDTKIGDIISKPKDYWYEIVLNPDTMPQTIIGYDDDGAKLFRLYPESKELEEDPDPEDIPVVDQNLDLTSNRPISNQAVAVAITQLMAAIEELKGNLPVAEETDASMFNTAGQVNNLSVIAIDAYAVAVRNGFTGTVQEWLDSLKGEKGEKGDTGSVDFDNMTEEQIALLRGEQGEPGVSPVAEVTAIDGGYRVTITDAEGTHTFNLLNGKDGTDGTDGVSATHSWNGTTLIVASASGTSSADLKGETGDKGEDAHGLFYSTEAVPDGGETMDFELIYIETYGKTLSPGDFLLTINSEVYRVESIASDVATATRLYSIKGSKGDTYVLTDDDKTEIAEQAASIVDTALLTLIGSGEVSA